MDDLPEAFAFEVAANSLELVAQDIGMSSTVIKAIENCKKLKILNINCKEDAY